MIGRLGLALAFIALGGLSALAESKPGDCNGIDFDAKQPLVVAKIAAKPRIHYVKSAWENAACPANLKPCKGKAYVLKGDLVLTGKTHGPYTCVAYQSPRDRKQIWTNGWIASSVLSPVAPRPSPRLSDWIGTWIHTGGEISIGKGKSGKLTIKGEQTYPAALNVHSGVIEAQVKPTDGILAFADDGGVAFDKASEGDCLVRMQRIGALLLVEDNGACGGSMVTFTGLYRRK
jgi:hypothetical protein